MDQLNMNEFVDSSIVTINQKQQINFFILIDIKRFEYINQIMLIAEKQILNLFFKNVDQQFFENFD